MAKIPTTGYAILAMLASQPLSTYELAQRMKLSFLRAIWPRAESRIYEEPKRLVREELASATSEPSGDRPRTLYRVTRKGRNQLKKWLSAPSQRFRYRSEALVKVAFADHGTREDLEKNIAELRDEALADAKIYLGVAHQSLQAGISPPEREHLSALVDEFILEMIEARLRWARFAEEFTRTWTEPTGSEATSKQAHAWWQSTAARLQRLVDEGETLQPGQGSEDRC
jgi:DNA-binding PadR family transcriptional regulator